MCYCDRHYAIICDDQKDRERAHACKGTYPNECVCCVDSAADGDAGWSLFSKGQYFGGSSRSLPPIVYCSLDFIAMRRWCWYSCTMYNVSLHSYFFLCWKICTMFCIILPLPRTYIIEQIEYLDSFSLKCFLTFGKLCIFFVLNVWQYIS